MTANLLPLFLLLASLLAGTRAQGASWAEETGEGRINGKSFPIAVIRNAGNDDAFITHLQKRFGPRYDIVRLPQGVLGYGSQYLVKPFKEDALRHLPLRRGGQDQGALEVFILEHAMTFSLLNIDGESLAIGSPVSALIGAAPGPVRDSSAFSFLQGSVRDAVELSFTFGAVEVTSLSGVLTVPAQDAKVMTRHAFAADGLQSPKRAHEANSIAGSGGGKRYEEFFTDGTNRAANVIINDQENHSDKREVTINVNRVHAKTKSR